MSRDDRRHLVQLFQIGQEFRRSGYCFVDGLAKLLGRESVSETAVIEALSVEGGGKVSKEGK